MYVGQIDTIEIALRTKSLNPNALDNQGGSLLQRAVYYNRRQLVMALLDCGADVMHAGGELQVINYFITKYLCTIYLYIITAIIIIVVIIFLCLHIIGISFIYCY